MTQKIKIIKYFIPSFTALVFVCLIVWAANTFPAVLNDWEDEDVIEREKEEKEEKI